MFKTIPKNTVEHGKRGEDYVCERISSEGYSIVDRNFREKFAEIDIVAMNGDVLCFIEVRTRQNTELGHPAETITPAKQQGIRRAAEAYIARKNIAPGPTRFDVATIVWENMEFEYFENAF